MITLSKLVYILCLYGIVHALLENTAGKMGVELTFTVNSDNFNKWLYETNQLYSTPCDQLTYAYCPKINVFNITRLSAIHAGIITAEFRTRSNAETKYSAGVIAFESFELVSPVPACLTKESSNYKTSDVRFNNVNVAEYPWRISTIVLAILLGIALLIIAFLLKCLCKKEFLFHLKNIFPRYRSNSNGFPAFSIPTAEVRSPTTSGTALTEQNQYDEINANEMNNGNSGPSLSTQPGILHSVAPYQNADVLINPQDLSTNINATGQRNSDTSNSFSSSNTEESINSRNSNNISNNNDLHQQPVYTNEK